MLGLPQIVRFVATRNWGRGGLEKFRYHVTLPALDLPQLASATGDRASVAQRRGFAKNAKNLCSARFFSHPPKYVIYVNGPDSRWSFSP